MTASSASFVSFRRFSLIAVLIGASGAACSSHTQPADVVDATAATDAACDVTCGSSCCTAEQQCDDATQMCTSPGCGSGPACTAGTACDEASGTCVEELRIATYNILGSHFLQTGSPICLGLTGAACTTLRARNAMKIIRGQAGFAAFDVVGVQEMERDQFIQIGKGLGGVDPAYAHEPLLYDRQPEVMQADYLTNNIDDYMRTLYWRRDRLEAVARGTVKYPTNDGTNVGVSRDSYAPWVELRSKTTGRMFVVLNHHAAVTTRNQFRSSTSAIFRQQTAAILAAWAASVRTQKHIPVVIIGDFNSTFTVRNVPPNDDDIAYGTDRSRLPYCVMTASGVLANASDTVAGLTGPCPTLVGNAVDHVYTTTDLVTVDRLVRVPKHDPATSAATDLVSHCSDHGPVYADVKL